MMRNKALRRHHAKRQLKKRQKDVIYARACDPDGELANGKHFKIRLRTPKPCSCFMCGNPRKFHGNGKCAKTPGELKAMADWRAGLREYYKAEPD